MNTFFISVLNSLWQSAALCAAVWLALRYSRGLNAATRHAVWWAVLAVVVLLPFVPHERRAPARAVVVETAEAVYAPVGPRQEHVPKEPIRLPSGEWPAVLFAAWMLACSVQLARSGWSYLHLRRLKRDARPAAPALVRNFEMWMSACRVRRPARLLLSSNIGSPIAVGFRQPAVLLPEKLLTEFADADLDHVLLHELAHMARRDDWTNLAARLAAGFLAFHPVAQFILRQIDREREMACDDWVVSMTGAARPYATSLTRLFELCRGRHRVLLATGMATRSSQLGERIESLLQARRQFLSKVSATKLGFACFALLLSALAFSRTPQLLALPQERRIDRTEKPAPPRQTGGFLAGLVAAGYGDMEVDDIVALKTNGINADFLIGISQAGWGKLNARELIDLRNHGVRPETVRRIHALGYGPYSVKEAIDLHNQGVGAEIFEAFYESGWKKLEVHDVIEAKQAGVSAASLREARQYGTSLTLAQIVRLKRAGVIQ